MPEKTIEELKAEIFSLQKANGEVAMMWAEVQAENQELKTAMRTLFPMGGTSEQLTKAYQLLEDRPALKLLDSPDWPFVAAYMLTMMEKLNKNLHKGSRGWLDMNLKQLVRRAEMEILELKNAIEFEGPDAAILETADVGAFMMMIHDKLTWLKSGPDAGAYQRMSSISGRPS